VETQRAIAAVNPILQPYKFIAELLFQQALASFKRGDTAGGTNLLELATTVANLAPLLTLLTVLAALAFITYLLRRRSQKARLKPTPVVPPPPPEIFPKSSQ